MLSQAKFFSKWEECGCYDFALFKSCFVVECTASTILAGCVNRFCRFDSFSDC